MNLQDTIELASGIAYEEDAEQMCIAHTDDLGRQSSMEGETFTVNAAGLKQ